MSPESPRIQERIEQKLAALEPVELRVTNESSQHNVAPGSETHFRVLLVSSELDGMSRVARHRAIHRLLADELAGSVHALAIDAWTPAEWRERSERATVSPECRGGAGR